MKKNEQDSMRMLSIGQPWAELILRRRKPFEIRSWKRSYRGKLLIHASKKWNAEQAANLGISKGDVTFGALVGIADLNDIRPFTKSDAALLKKRRGGNGWQKDQFAWVMKSVKRIKPIPFKGQLGLISPPMRIVRKVTAELGTMKSKRRNGSV